jgi:hypothetical protein
VANIYVRSTDGSNTDDGSTWALAKLDLAGAAAIDAAGDNIYLSQAHSESTAAAVTIALAGTLANPVKVICVNDGAAPPTAVATTAVVKTTGASAITVAGNAYIRGVTFQSGEGSASSTAAGSYNSNVTTANARQTYENCTMSVLSTGTSAHLNFGAAAAGSNEINSTRLVNCSLGLASSTAGILIYGNVRIEGGSLVSGFATTSTLFRVGGISRATELFVDGFDFSNLNAACSLVLPTNYGRFTFANCKMPTSWTGGLISGSPIGAFRASMYNCDNADTNYRLWIEDYAGSIVSETTIVRTGGATDGTTPISWKMTTSANANEYVAPLISDPISVWNDTTGSAKTITVEIIHDSVTALTDAEVWLEVTYLGTSGFPLGSVTTDHRADILATAASQTSSSETWTTTGLTSPNKQKLSVPITPQKKGFITARVFVGKPSYTIYVDPEITVT